jgi:NADH-quinone oxidoreductase subunit N
LWDLIVVKVAEDGRNLDIEHLAGLTRRSPILAMALMPLLFDLAGISTTIGFTGKLLIPGKELPDLKVSPSIKVLAGLVISGMGGIFPNYIIELSKSATLKLM